MDTSIALDLARQTLMLTLMIMTPLLLVGLVVGVLLSILQAVTQIQEMTLTFVPKIVAMVLAGMLLMPWILQHLMQFSQTMFSTLPVK